MPIIAFPPFNPGAYQDTVADDLFDGTPLPTTFNDAAPSNLSSGLANQGVANRTQSQLEKMWDHLLIYYWPELYNDTNLSIASGGPPPAQKTGAETVIQNFIFKELMDQFENDFLDGYVGISKSEFYGNALFSDASKIDIWDGFIRTQEIGRKQYNVLLWIWELLINLLGTMQDSTVNKATAQRWMSEAQKQGVAKMAEKEFRKQSDTDDFGAIHHNQTISHELDILRGERGGVQRLSSEKGTDAANAQQRMQENNTFIALLIDQLGTALRAIIKR